MFANYNLWVTPTVQAELMPAGDCTQRSTGKVPSFTSDDRSITDTDVTLWHSWAPHDVRVEDYRYAYRIR